MHETVIHLIALFILIDELALDEGCKGFVDAAGCSQVVLAEEGLGVNSADAPLLADGFEELLLVACEAHVLTLIVFGIGVYDVGEVAA